MLRTFYHPIHIAVTEPAAPVSINSRLPDHFRKITGVRLQHRGGVEQILGPLQQNASGMGSGSTTTQNRGIAGTTAIPRRFGPGSTSTNSQTTPVVGGGLTQGTGTSADPDTPVRPASNLQDIERIGTAYLEINNQTTKLGSFYCSYEASLGGCADFVPMDEELQPGTLLTGCYVNELSYQFYDLSTPGILDIVPNGYMATIWLRVLGYFEAERQTNLTTNYGYER